MFKILLLALSASVQDSAILLQSWGIFTGSLSSFVFEFKIMLITYKVLHDRAPIYIQELLQLFIIWPKQTGPDEIQAKMYKVKTMRTRKLIHNIFEPGAPS